MLWYKEIPKDFTGIPRQKLRWCLWTAGFIILLYPLHHLKCLLSFHLLLERLEHSKKMSRTKLMSLKKIYSKHEFHVRIPGLVFTGDQSFAKVKCHTSIMRCDKNWGFSRLDPTIPHQDSTTWLWAWLSPDVLQMEARNSLTDDEGTTGEQKVSFG